MDKGQCPDEVPGHIGILETLNIFGLKADYMDEFSRIIKDEGVEVNVHDKVKVELPLMPNVVDLEKKRLKYLCLKKGKNISKMFRFCDWIWMQLLRQAPLWACC